MLDIKENKKMISIHISIFLVYPHVRGKRKPLGYCQELQFGSRIAHESSQIRTSG
jgi:hypothetical protein